MRQFLFVCIISPPATTPLHSKGILSGYLMRLATKHKKDTLLIRKNSVHVMPRSLLFIKRNSLRQKESSIDQLVFPEYVFIS